MNTYWFHQLMGGGSEPIHDWAGVLIIVVVALVLLTRREE